MLWVVAHFVVGGRSILCGVFSIVSPPTPPTLLSTVQFSMMDACLHGGAWELIAALLGFASH